MIADLKKTVGIVFAISLAMSASNVLAGPYYDEREEGWFWYEDPVQPEPKEEKEPPEPEPKPLESPKPKNEEQEITKADPADVGPAPFSSQWIQAEIPKAMDRAINNPTKENVRVLAYLQRLMMDKASRFSEQFHQVAMTDPVLDETKRMPLNAVGKSYFLRERKKARKEALDYLADKSGIWYFYDTSCEYCQLQAPIITKVAERYGFILFSISLDGKRIPNLGGKHLVDEGQAKRFEVEVVPAMVLATPPDKYVVLSQGMLGIEELEERLLIAAAEQDLLPQDLYERAYPTKKGILTTEAMQDGGQSVDPDDPTTWVNEIRTQLGYQPINTDEEATDAPQ